MQIKHNFWRKSTLTLDLENLLQLMKLMALICFVHQIRFKRGIRILHTRIRPRCASKFRTCYLLVSLPLNNLLVYLIGKLNHGYPKRNPLHPRLW